MSYRELRNFTEMMRVLNYPRVISMDNFRRPNFELVADVLYFMAKRYDPEIAVHEGIESEDDRVVFLTGIVHEVETRASIQLNAQRLYAADGYAVKELLKLATVLYRASKLARSPPSVRHQQEDEESSPSIDSHRMQDARALARELTESGARLYDLLKLENETKPQRSGALKYMDVLSASDDGPEHEDVENALSGIIGTVRGDTEKIARQCQNLESDAKGLDQKIWRKRGELERFQKRLANWQNHRPPFMDEYELLEGELKKQYEEYTQRNRNLDYMKSELDKYRAAEKEKEQVIERSMKRVQKRFQKEQLMILRSDIDMISQEQTGQTGKTDAISFKKAPGSWLVEDHSQGSEFDDSPSHDGEEGESHSGSTLGSSPNNKPTSESTSSQSWADEETLSSESSPESDVDTRSQVSFSDDDSDNNF